MSGDDRQNSPSISRQNRPSATPHLWKIDEIAHCRMERLTEKLLERNPAPDKATQQLAWVQHMNMLKAQAEEIIVAELIYS